MIGGGAEGVSAEPSPAVFSLHRRFRDEYRTFRRALLLEGIDAHLVHGWVSAAHDDVTIDTAVDAFGRAMDRTHP